MTPTAYITTSWDDGHPLDLRVADLLTKYGLSGTFYVPMTADCETMTAPQLRQLSSGFEVGAHTLHHVDLCRATDQVAWEEIAASKSWLEESTGLPCPMFCPPKGKYYARHLALCQRAGYGGVRTAEPLSLDFPVCQRGLFLLPTTVHACPHSLVSYARYLARRAAFKNLWRYILHGRTIDWVKLADSLLSQTLERGGVFHLWGHSWELQATGQWQRLDNAFRFMSQFTAEAPALTNWQLCQATTVSRTTVPVTCSMEPGKTNLLNWNQQHGTQS